MTVIANTQSLHTPQHLDFKMVMKGMGMLGGVLAVMAPFSPDPLPFAVGAAVPWICLRIVYTPLMPSAVIYLFVWQWLQIFARLPQAWIDGESLATSLSGPNVVRAYWYMMSSLVVLAIVFRGVMSRQKPPTKAQAAAHLRWTIRDVTLFYIFGFIVSTVGATVGRFSGGLAQPAEAVGYLKVVSLFTLFCYVLTTGRGTKVLLAVTIFEVGLGFTGYLSDFRSVFIYLAIAAITSRIEWKFSTGLASVFGLVALTTLALFWTSVKMEYREFASGGSDSQVISVPLGERMAYLGDKALAFGDIKLGETSYQLLSRFAYVDIFASVIDVQEQQPEPIFMRQWKDALSHVFQPRFLFPDKPELSDTEVYLRLTQRSLVEQISNGTSISVGYMGENFADLGFPGMLVGIAMVGIILAGCMHILMSFKLPQVMREGIAMAFCFAMARDGVEVSIPKMIGTAVMFTLVFATVVKFVAPRIVEWLDYGATLGKAAPRVARR